MKEQRSDSLRARIITYASKQFLAHGYSHISTATLAVELGMSKTTLYKLFPSKEALLEAVIDHFFLQIRQEVAAIDQQNIPGAQKLEQYLHSIVERLAAINTFALQDIQRTVPSAYERFVEQRRQTLQTVLLDFFEKRVAEGIFRQDLDQALVIQVMLTGLQALTNPEVLRHTSYSLAQMSHIVATLVLEGNLTEEGRRLTAARAAPPQAH